MKIYQLCTIPPNPFLGQLRVEGGKEAEMERREGKDKGKEKAKEMQGDGKGKEGIESPGEEQRGERKELREPGKNREEKGRN